MPASDMPELPFDAPRRWAMARTSQTLGASAQDSTPLSAKPEVEGLELFQAAPANDGYARWKAEVAAARQAAESLRRASELPVAEDADGYAAWKAEAEAARRQFEQRWGVPLGKPVRLQLRGELHEREGTLRLAEEPSATAPHHLRLRIGSHSFPASQIESLVRL